MRDPSLSVGGRPFNDALGLTPTMSHRRLFGGGKVTIQRFFQRTNEVKNPTPFLFTIPGDVDEIDILAIGHGGNAVQDGRSDWYCCGAGGGGARAIRRLSVGRIGRDLRILVPGNSDQSISTSEMGLGAWTSVQSVALNMEIVGAQGGQGGGRTASRGSLPVSAGGDHRGIPGSYGSPGSQGGDYTRGSNVAYGGGAAGSLGSGQIGYSAPLGVGMGNMAAQIDSPGASIGNAANTEKSAMIQSKHYGGGGSGCGIWGGGTPIIDTRGGDSHVLIVMRGRR